MMVEASGGKCQEKNKLRVERGGGALRRGDQDGAVRNQEEEIPQEGRRGVGSGSQLCNLDACIL